MLSLRRVPLLARRPLAVAASRGLCAPAVPLKDQVAEDIAMMEEKISNFTPAGYSPAAFEAAMKEGKVDLSELNAAMAGYSESARKVCAKSLSDPPPFSHSPVVARRPPLFSLQAHCCR